MNEPEDGYCVCCNQLRPSLPKPAEGTCAYCFNHLMIVSYPEIMEAYRRFKDGVVPTYSTGICESTTAGYGKLDDNGYWEFPLYVNQKTFAITLVDIL